jgi:glycosyltransferase involved in cell wall biosynthesis
MVSVLITNYNNERWIAECVDSALGQTRPPDEIIVFDDGSTDGSLPILRAYGSRIRLIEATHGTGKTGRENLARATHQALLASTGTHIHILDGDDIYLPSRIAAYEAAWARCPEAVLVQAPMRWLNEQGVWLRDNIVEHRRVTDHLAHYYRTGETDLFYPSSSLAFRRDYLLSRLPLDFSDGQNLPVDMRLSAAAPFFGKVICLEEPHTSYRWRRNSVWTREGSVSYRKRTAERVGFLNSVAAKCGLRPIPVWRNPTWRRKVLRELVPNPIRKSIAFLKRQKQRAIALVQS